MSFFNSLKPKEKEYRSFEQKMKKWISIWLLGMISLWFFSSRFDNFRQIFIVEPKVVGSACDLGNLKNGSQVIWNGGTRTILKIYNWSHNGQTQIDIQ